MTAQHLDTISVEVWKSQKRFRLGNYAR